MSAQCDVQNRDFIHRRTRNPLLVARAVWRLVRDPGATEEATILEDVFARSPRFRKYARWDRVAHRLLPGVPTTTELQQLPRALMPSQRVGGRANAPGRCLVWTGVLNGSVPSMTSGAIWGCLKE